MFRVWLFAWTPWVSLPQVYISWNSFWNLGWFGGLWNLRISMKFHWNLCCSIAFWSESSMSNKVLALKTKIVHFVHLYSISIVTYKLFTRVTSSAETFCSPHFAVFCSLAIGYTAQDLVLSLRWTRKESLSETRQAYETFVSQIVVLCSLVSGYVAQKLVLSLRFHISHLKFHLKSALVSRNNVLEMNLYLT